MRRIKKYLLAGWCLATGILSSCNKLIEIPESRSSVESTVIYSDSLSAVSALLGIYSTLGTQSGAVSERFRYVALYADEYIYSGTGIESEFNTSQISTTNSANSTLWNNLYSVIYQCNAVIEGVEKSSGLSVTAKTSLTAEAKFLRAFTNFHLVNLYDNIPLILTTNVDQNRRSVQNTPEVVYEQILTDLEYSGNALGNTYAGTGKVRANSLSAIALRSRVYLYQGKWQMVKNEADKLINSGLFTPLPALDQVFLSGSKEAILQFWSNGGFISDATAVIPSSSSVMPNYTLSWGLYQAFDDADGRKRNWVGTNRVTINGVTTPYYYPSKYKNRIANTVLPEFVMAFRLTEQYLNRAEAYAMTDNIPAAVDDLNVVRARATGIGPLDRTLSKPDCLKAIAKERRLELFGEWGLRFFDLKRTGELKKILSILKPGWNPAAKAFPIPQTERTYNSNLNQNDGY